MGNPAGRSEARSEIRSVIDKYGFTFKKGLGQNFLTDDAVLEKVASAGESRCVVEIGPGFGVLTRELARKYEKVVSVEIDDRLIPILEETLCDFDNVKIIHGDCMKLDFAGIIKEEFGDKTVSVAANLPYYITTPIIAMLLEKKLPLKNITVMVQKEVAERICASPGGKEYGAVSVMCGYYTKPEIMAKVPASAFIPPPKVDSAVLNLRVLDEPAVKTNDERMFFRVVKAAFAQRRKTLLNALYNGGFGTEKSVIEDILTRLDINPSARGETLGLVEFAAVSDEFCKIIGKR
ncbi:MAG: 16S rRNA (adenine(1518)-N(6)/adenine(1519)-N(6))-dimethyltransferase RsmA [Oscillospiraceae bacterium]|nr:16S rRNA (adenine(1518)-N(6)/adenine(1519)-N(6))-dimethyltransferase RsmA [Oscillospiraceae bacterium]